MFVMTVLCCILHVLLCCFRCCWVDRVVVQALLAMILWDMCVCDDCSVLYTTCVTVLFQVLLGRQGGGAGTAGHDTVGYVCL